MIVAARERLRQNGELSQSELLNELAQFPDVVVRSARPTVLELISR